VRSTCGVGPLGRPVIATDRVRRAFNPRALYEYLTGAGAMNVLIRGAALSFLIGVATRFVSFPVNIVLARSMGAEEFGVYSYVGTWGFLLMLLGLLGFDSALKRFVAAYRATGSMDLLGGVIRRAHELVLISSIALGLLLMLTTLWFQDELGRSLTLTLLVAAIALPFDAVHQLQMAALVSLKRFATSQTLGYLVPPVLIGAAAGGLYLARGTVVRSYEVYALGLVATFVMLAVGAFLLKRALPEAVASSQRVFRTREWLRVSVPMLMVDGIRELMNRSDIILIGILMGTTPAGIYLIALNIARFTSYGLQATTTAALPVIAELHTLGKHEELQRVFSVACWASTLATGAVAVVVLVLREPLLQVFGAEFAAGATVLAILIVGRFLDSWTGPNGSLLNMTGHQDVYAVILGVTAGMNAVLTVPAILQWGIEGAAVVTGLSLAVKNVLVWVVVKRQMGINASIFGPLPLRGW